MSEELSLKETIKKLEEKVSESLEGKSKKPKFKLPLGIRMSKGKLKKNFILVLYINSNLQTKFEYHQIKDDTVMVNDAIYDARGGNILRYKNTPLLIINESNTQPFPFSPEEDYKEAEEQGNLTSPQRLILTKMKMEALKPSSPINAKTIILLAIMLGVGYFALDYFSVLG